MHKPIDTQDDVSTTEARNAEVAAFVDSLTLEMLKPNRANPVVVQISAEELEDYLADDGGIEIDAESLNFYRVDDVTEIDSLDPDPPEMYDDEFVALKMSGDLYMGLRHRARRLGLTMRELLCSVADKSDGPRNTRLIEP